MERKIFVALTVFLLISLCLVGSRGEGGEREYDGGLPVIAPHAQPGEAAAAAAQPGVKKASKEDIWDENGYVMFCLCMGRFGNQVDHFLGTMAFAKAINRTLVVPPFISYTVTARTTFMPFEDLFRLPVLKSYHRAISMEAFFKKFSDRWPPGSRVGQCYSQNLNSKTCRHKEGNPFGPFWDHFGVNFDSYEPYLLNHASDPYTIQQWKQRFPASTNPILALPGAPAEFPVSAQNRHLQQYLKWNQKMNTSTENFISNSLQRPFIGIHLRNGEDWSRACEGISSSNGFYMGSPQCQRPGLELTKNICFPNDETVISQVLEVAKKIDAKSLFIATDDRSMTKEFQDAFKRNKLQISIARNEASNLHLDLAILGQADYFIGNCISTFTSFAKRERDLSNKPSEFWGVSIVSHKK